LLSDRIIVMGNPPRSSVLEDMPIALPRPRTPDMVSLDPRGRANVMQLLALLGAPVEELDRSPDGALAASSL
jgi:ABC-type nitrate/sulfonate/bicarbonate transport system ATPase subunit